jgi:hypothetical protein
VDFFRAGVEVVGVEANAEGASFAMLIVKPSTRVRQVVVVDPSSSIVQGNDLGTAPGQSRNDY